MKRLAVALLVLLLGAWKPSPPAGTLALFSQSYQLSAVCTGGDMVYTWGVNGNGGNAGVVPATTAYGASFMYPFEPDDITIRAVELTELPPSPGAALPAFTFLMSGNDSSGDAMVFLDAQHTHVLHDFPAGSGFQFPGIINADPLSYIDLHGACTSGDAATVMVVYYFTRNGLPASPAGWLMNAAPIVGNGDSGPGAWNNYTIAAVIPWSQLIYPDAGSEARVRLQAANGGAWTIDAAEVCQLTAWGAAATNCTQLTFGGQPGATIAAASGLLSDGVAFSFPATANVLVKVHSVSGQFRYAPSGAAYAWGWQAYYIAGNDALTTNTSGYTAGLGANDGVAEVDGNFP